VNIFTKNSRFQENLLVFNRLQVWQTSLNTSPTAHDWHWVASPPTHEKNLVSSLLIPKRAVLPFAFGLWQNPFGAPKLQIISLEFHIV